MAGEPQAPNLKVVFAFQEEEWGLSAVITVIWIVPSL